MSLVVPLALLIVALLLQRMEAALLSAPCSLPSDASGSGGAVPDPAPPAVLLHAKPDDPPLGPAPPAEAPASA
jgi:hypothetical protein